MSVNREYPEAPVVGVGVVVARDDRVLLVKRGKEPGYGQWSIPGGAVELGETIQVAAAREVKEECDLDVDIAEVIEVLERIMLDPQGRVRYHYVLIDYLGWYVAGEFHPSDELLDGVWITAEELDRYKMPDVTRRVIAKAFALMAKRR